MLPPRPPEPPATPQNEADTFTSARVVPYKRKMPASHLASLLSPLIRQKRDRLIESSGELPLSPPRKRKSSRSLTSSMVLSRPSTRRLPKSSRHKVRNEIFVGNSSQYLPPESRAPGELATHKWMVYVRAAKHESDMRLFVDRVLDDCEVAS